MGCHECLRAYSSVWKLRRARSAQTACGQRINEFPQTRHQVVQEPGVTGLLCAPKMMVSMAGATILSLVSDSLASLRSAIWVTNSYGCSDPAVDFALWRLRTALLLCLRYSTP